MCVCPWFQTSVDESDEYEYHSEAGYVASSELNIQLLTHKRLPGTALCPVGPIHHAQTPTLSLECTTVAEILAKWVQSRLHL